MSATASPSTPTPNRWFDIRRDEWPALASCFALFFCILCGYMVLRPVRDEMGIQAGIKNIAWLFTATFIGMLALQPLFGWVSSRWPRKRFLPVVFLFFIINLLIFYAAMTAGADKAMTAKAFFVWLSVMNYFVVSVFWSFMTDIFTNEQSKRLFGAIAAGGSAGAIVGPAITQTLVTATGIPPLLLISAALFSAAIALILFISRWAGGTPGAELALGGGVLEGFRMAFTSKYLLAICGYILLLSTLATFLYVEQSRIVEQTISSPQQRTQLFARIDLVVNSLTIVLQLVLTSQLIRRVGVGACLMLLPALAIVGFIAVGIMPVLEVFVVLSVLRRAAEYAIAKPAREVLFTVVSREARYKAKNLIDTAVARGGDMLSSWLNTLIKGLGANASQMGFAAVPIGVLLLGVGWWLGREQERKASEQQ